MKNSSKTPTFVDQNKIYHMKRTLLLIFTLLTVTLAAVAQPRISSNKETHNFGQIEWKKPVTVEYTITNTGNEPLVLTNVTTSCACAVADWTKEPIAPGAKGTVKASFDAKALGRFDKSIGIYSNATPNLVYLKFTGEVVQEIKDYSKLLPYAIGNIRIDRDEFSFPDVYRGQQPSMTFSIANLSDRPYEPVLMHLPPYLKMEAEPKVLLKGKKGTIKLTLDASQLQDFGLTQTSVFLAKKPGEKVSIDKEISVSAVLLPDFDNMSETQLANAPSIKLSATELDFGDFGEKPSKTETVIIENTGRSVLDIRSMQMFTTGMSVKLNKTKIKPGEQAKLKVTLNKKQLRNARSKPRVLIITNDPKQPKVVVKMKLKTR